MSRSPYAFSTTQLHTQRKKKKGMKEGGKGIYKAQTKTKSKKGLVMIPHNPMIIHLPSSVHSSHNIPIRHHSYTFTSPDRHARRLLLLLLLRRARSLPLRRRRQRRRKRRRRRGQREPMRRHRCMCMSQCRRRHRRRRQSRSHHRCR